MSTSSTSSTSSSSSSKMYHGGRSWAQLVAHAIAIRSWPNQVRNLMFMLSLDYQEGSITRQELDFIDSLTRNIESYRNYF